MQNKRILVGINYTTDDITSISGINITFTPEKIELIKKSMLACQEIDFDYATIPARDFRIMNGNKENQEWTSDSASFQVSKRSLIFHAQNKYTAESFLDTQEIGAGELGIEL